MSYYVVGVILPKHVRPDGSVKLELDKEEAGSLHNFGVVLSEAVTKLVHTAHEVDRIEAEVSRLLLPYDENTRLPEYETECWCIASGERRRAREYADTEAGPLNTYRETFESTFAPFSPAAREMSTIEYVRAEEAEQDRWKAHAKPWFDAYAWFEENDPERGQPDPLCGIYTAEWLEKYPNPEAQPGDKMDDEDEYCFGTGKATSTYNPLSRWDWWVIGGRWDGFFGGKNVELVRNVSEEDVPRAIVTPDGKWHERGRMGWFGMSDDTMRYDEWLTYRDGIFAEHLDHTIVAVDCHI